MPKSKHRRGRRAYRPRPVGVYGVDPLMTFRLIGAGSLEPDEEEAACLLLLHEMGSYDPQTMQVICENAGLSDPPSTTEDIRIIARALDEESHDALS